MAMWAIQGIGLLINTIQSMQQANQMRQMQQSQQATLDQMKQEATGGMKKGPQTKSIFNFEHPPYPEDNFKNLQQQQMGQAENRQSHVSKLQQDLHDMKNEFFANNHYETTQGPDGKPKVAVDAQGKPQVAPGAENPDQKLARVDHESECKKQLTQKHTEEKENFLKEEKQNIKQFLTENRDQLSNPTIHGELQKMMIGSKKKSLQMQQNHEDERFKVDLPPEQKIALRLEQGTKDLHQMDQQHMQSEQDSPDAKALMEHDQKIAAILGEQRENARQERREDEFLLDPRKMMAARAQASAPKDVGDHLPGYLTANLYEMGIYSV